MYEPEEREWPSTQIRGKLEDEYEIYVANTDHNPPMTFDEWLDN